MKLPHQKGFTPIIILLVVGVTALGGTATVVASNDSKPGDPLYGIDQTVEDVQLALLSEASWIFKWAPIGTRVLVS